MKKLLILVYVLVVATLSINARANTEVPLFVEQINYDAEAQLLQVDGYFPNPCVSQPTLQLSLNEKDQLVLSINGQSESDICITVVGPKFMLAVELNELKSQLSRLNLDDNGTYQLYDLSGKLIADIDFSGIYFSIPLQATHISGLLSLDNKGLFLTDTEGQRYDVQSPLQNIEALSDSQVTLTGHMNAHSVSVPVFNTKKSALQFIATGVSFSTAN